MQDNHRRTGSTRLGWYERMVIKMCGGFRPDWASSKMRLVQGQRYSFPTDNGELTAIFDGHARIESMDKWANRIDKHINIKAESFEERNTVAHKYNEFVGFKTNGRHIHGIILTKTVYQNGRFNKEKYFRIVTKPADENIKKVHHRMPDLGG